MQSLRKIYESLSDENKDQFMRCIHQCLMWRGWDGEHLRRGSVLPPHAVREIDKVAEILLSAGHDIEEYI